MKPYDIFHTSDADSEEWEEYRTRMAQLLLSDDTKAFCLVAFQESEVMIRFGGIPGVEPRQLVRESLLAVKSAVRLFR